MTRLAWIVWSAMVPGCIGPPDTPCPDVTIEGHPPESGLIRIEYAGSGLLYDLAHLPSTEGLYSASGDGNLVGDPSDGELDVDYRIGFTAHRPTFNAVIIATQLGDIRTLEQGDVTLANDGQAQYQPPCAGCTQRCNVYGVAFESEVLEAVGEAAPYPAAVTPDFHRRLEIRSVSDRLVDRTNPACTPVYFELELELTIDASDFVATASTGCEG